MAIAYGIIILFLILYLFKSIIHITYLYISNGADGRSPYLIALQIVLIWMAASIIYSFISKEVAHFTQLTSLVLGTFITLFLLKGRLVGYPLGNLSMNKRKAMSIFSIAFFLVIIIFYISIMNFIRQPETNCFKSASDFIELAQIFFGIKEYFIYPHLRPLANLGNMILASMIIYFDIVERRSKKTIRTDFYLFSTFLIIEIAYIIHHPIGYALGLCYLTTVYFLATKKEINSCILHATDLSPNYTNCKDALFKLYKKYPHFTEKDYLIMSTIASIARSNPSIRKDLIEKKTASPLKYSVNKRIKALMDKEIEEIQDYKDSYKEYYFHHKKLIKIF